MPRGGGAGHLSVRERKFPSEQNIPKPMIPLHAALPFFRPARQSRFSRAHPNIRIVPVPHWQVSVLSFAAEPTLLTGEGLEADLKCGWSPPDVVFSR